MAVQKITTTCIDVPIQNGKGLYLHVTTLTLSLILTLTLQPYPNPTDPNHANANKKYTCITLFTYHSEEHNYLPTQTYLAVVGTV